MKDVNDGESLKELTERIIGCAYAVSNELGCGFLEKVYENALTLELHQTGLEAEKQKHISVYYCGTIVGEYVADLIVDRQVLVEVKSVKGLDDVHLAQCLNYLRATALKICLLLNFARPRLEIKRVVHNL